MRLLAKVAPVLLGLVASALLAPRAEAQTALDQDPNATRLLYTLHLRMWDVQIPPGAAAVEHRHDHDIATVALTGGVAQVMDYTGAPAAHRLEAAGDAPRRFYVFENMRDSGWTMPRAMTGPGTALTAESRGFAVYEVRLSAAAPETTHVHDMPSVVTLLAGSVDVQGGGGETPFTLSEPGRWFPSTWEAPHTLRLPDGVSEAHLICVEAR